MVDESEINALLRHAAASFESGAPSPCIGTRWGNTR
jgi:hypothetical protein